MSGRRSDRDDVPAAAGPAPRPPLPVIPRLGSLTPLDFTTWQIEVTDIVFVLKTVFGLSDADCLRLVAGKACEDPRLLPSVTAALRQRNVTTASELLGAIAPLLGFAADSSALLRQLAQVKQLGVSGAVDLSTYCRRLVDISALLATTGVQRQVKDVVADLLEAITDPDLRGAMAGKSIDSIADLPGVFQEVRLVVGRHSTPVPAPAVAPSLALPASAVAAVQVTSQADGSNRTGSVESQRSDLVDVLVAALARGQRGHGPSRGKKGKGPRCYNCKGFGHISKVCPSPSSNKPKPSEYPAESPSVCHTTAAVSDDGFSGVAVVSCSLGVVLLDTGAAVSLISSRSASRLGLASVRAPLALRGPFGDRLCVFDRVQVPFQALGVAGAGSFPAHVCDDLPFHCDLLVGFPAIRSHPFCVLPQGSELRITWGVASWPVLTHVPLPPAQVVAAVAAGSPPVPRDALDCGSGLPASFDPFAGLPFPKDAAELRHQVALACSRAAVVNCDRPAAGVAMRLELSPNAPPTWSAAPRRFSPVQEEKILREVEALKRAGRIYPTDSPRYISPVLLVPRADGRDRLVVDYRFLNDFTLGQTFPLPLVEEVTDRIRDCVWFTSLDLEAAFHQLALDPASQPLSCFAAPDGVVYAWRRVAFGLKNAPAVMQEALMRVLSPTFARTSCRSHGFIDDVLVASKSFAAHVADVRVVVTALLRAGFSLKLPKCNIACAQVRYLGYDISAAGVSLPRDRVAAIIHSPAPTSVSELRRFLGACQYYRRWIRGFASIAQPLTALTKAGVAFAWSAQQDAAFRRLKDALSSAPVLQAPDWTRQFRLHCDASDVAVGAVLAQVAPTGVEYIVSCWSRQLSPAQSRYSAADRELLAVVSAIAHWRHYLQHAPFLVFTDHRNLSFILRMPDSYGRRARWLEFLRGFSFSLLHKSGASNLDADFLSRLDFDASGSPVLEAEPMLASIAELPAVLRDLGFDDRDADLDDSPSPAAPAADAASPTAASPATPAAAPPVARFPVKWFHTTSAAESVHVPDWPEIAAAQRADPFCARVLASLTASPSAYLAPAGLPDSRFVLRTQPGSPCPLLVVRHAASPPRPSSRVDSPRRFPDRIVVPLSLQNAMLRLAHDRSGHLGIAATQYWLQSCCWWRRQSSDAADYVRACVSCARRKTPSASSSGPLLQFSASRPGEIVHMDIVGPVTASTSGFRYIITLVDKYSRWVEAYPARSITAVDVADALFQYVSRFGLMTALITDQGRQFMSAVFQSVCGLLGVDHIHTTPYHPAANGAVERQHRTLMSVLSLLTQSDDHQLALDWDRYLPVALLMLRTVPSSATSCAPAQLMLSFSPQLPLSSLLGPASDDTQSPLPKLSVLADRVARSMSARHAANARASRLIDAHYQVGDIVLVRMDAPAQLLRANAVKKLAPPWSEPCRVVKILSPVLVSVVPLREVGVSPDAPVTVHVQRLFRLFAADVELVDLVSPRVVVKPLADGSQAVPSPLSSLV